MSNHPFRPGADAGPPVEPELAEFADLAERIAGFDVSSHSRIRDDLQRRLSEQQRRRPGGFLMHTTRQRRHPVRTFVVAFALILALSLSLAPTRAALAAFLQQIGLVRVSDAPTLAEELEGQPVPPPPAADAPAPTVVPLPPLLSVAEAAQAYGGQVYAPAALPDGFSLLGREVHGGSGGSRVSAFYTDPSTMLDTGPVFIKLDQFTGSTLQDLAIGDAPTTQVTVRGQPGLWIEGASLMWKDDGAGNLIGAPINILVWSEGGTTFTLESNHLGMSALLQIAEGLE